MPYTYEYPHPAVTVDCVVFGADIDRDTCDLRLLLIQRAEPPFAGSWALPGGFVEIDEALDDAARRELEEEAGLRNVFLEQLYTFGKPERDPRERIISVAYYALVPLASFVPRAGSDAAKAEWFPVAELPALAFDHDEVIATALARLRGKVRYAPIGFHLLPKAGFTLAQLQSLYESLLDRALDKSNFRKRVLAMGLLEEVGEEKAGAVPHRAAKIYRFNPKRYAQLERRGFNFEM